MDTAYMIVDKEFKLLYFNEIAIEWFAKHQQIDITINQDFVPLAKEDRRERLTKALNNALNGEKINYEVRYDAEDGNSYWFITRMFAIKNKANETLGLCIYIADITERKKTELALKISYERYDYVSKVTSDAIWDWDVIANTLYWNETYTHLFGYEKVTERNNIGGWEEKIHPDDRTRVVENIQSVLNDGNKNYWEDEYRYIKKDGTIAYVLDRGHILFDEHHIPFRMIGAMEDITNRKLYEIEREQITKDLLQRNKDLEQFAFIVSHNLRSHIANILGLSELLNSGLLDPTEKDSIFDALHISSKKLDTVIKDLSYILQVKRDVNEKKELINFAELIHDVETSLNNIINKENAEIFTNFKPIENIYSLKTYLYSIFHNLISNSLKYKQLDISPVIKIYTELTEKEIIIHYKDNGCGIDLELNGNYIFGLYKRFNDTIEGKGMGLFMVKTQVEVLGGSISVESAPGKGIYFTIRFRKTDLYN
jgi:PAS domain S-box-containing protein